MRLVAIDIETFSTLDLRKCGTYEYAQHHSTEILCVCWRELGTTRRMCWSSWGEGNATDRGLLNLLYDPEVVFVAHNAAFERILFNSPAMLRLLKLLFIKEHLPPRDAPYIPTRRFRCTQVLALCNGLPARLELAAKVLRLEVQKDMGGNRIMLQVSRPRKPTAKDPRVRFVPGDAQYAEKWTRLLNYCYDDADACAQIWEHSALRNLRDEDWEDYCVNEAINDRGIAIDRDFVQRLQQLCKAAQQPLADEFKLLTGHSPTEVQSFLVWLDAHGVELKDCSKDEITAALSSPDLLNVMAAEKLVTGTDVHRALSIRLEFAKASIKKLDSMLYASAHDGRARGTIQFSGAGTTGRGAGRLIQTQNYPRNVLSDAGTFKKLLARDGLRLLDALSDPLASASSMLRPCLIPKPGCVFIVLDWNAIEARALGWFADDAFYMESFAGDGLIYERMAARIFGMLVEQIGKESAERFLGKTTILGCGYQMGLKKFIATARKQGSKESDAVLTKAHTDYRNVTADGIGQFWYAIEEAARHTVRTQSVTKVAGGKIQFAMYGDALVTRLPSGRKLIYRGIHEADIPAPWQTDRPIAERDLIKQLQYWTQKTKGGWTTTHTYGGKLTENVDQAFCNDLLRHALRKLVNMGCVIHVHDEGVLEVRAEDGERVLEQARAVMLDVPRFADGLPLAVAGGIRYWYGK